MVCAGTRLASAQCSVIGAQDRSCGIRGHDSTPKPQTLHVPSFKQALGLGKRSPDGHLTLPQRRTSKVWSVSLRPQPRGLNSPETLNSLFSVLPCDPWRKVCKATTPRLQMFHLNPRFRIRLHMLDLGSRYYLDNIGNVGIVEKNMETALVY